MARTFRRTTLILCAMAAGLIAHAQSDDDFFFDDDLFDDTVAVTTESSAGAGRSDLNHGVLFENGSVRLGGSVDTSLGLTVPLYDPDNEGYTLGDNIWRSTLSPTADVLLYVDARPTQALRLYTKFGWTYPYERTTTVPFSRFPAAMLGGMTIPDISVGNSSFYVKELFTDFSVADRVFFRFGQHTVSWGTGYFFSPVSDMINSSAIDPENPTAQVNGSLNLRAQVVFPGTQNTLWLYLVPAKPGSGYTAASYARDTALAAKGEIVLGSWELGAGALYKYQTAPKAMLTASGSIFGGKVAVFGESVFQYGSTSEWKDDAESWADKTFIVKATAGASYYWKDPKITFMAQYYFDGDSEYDKYSTKGSNLACTVMFSELGTDKLSLTLMGLFAFGKEAVITDTTDTTSENGIIRLTANGIPYSPYAALASAMLSYQPVKNLSVSAGPYLTWQSWNNAPTVSLKISATLGGGSF